MRNFERIQNFTYSYTIVSVKKTAVMGASNSKLDAFIKEQEVIEDILKKSSDSMTEEEKDMLRAYIEKYEQIVERFLKVLDKIEFLLNGGKAKTPVKEEEEWSQEEQAEIKLTRVITNLKRKMNQFMASSDHFKSLAKKNRANEELCKEYLITSKNLMRDADEMGQYLAAMEEKLHDLTTANVTLEHVILLSGVADALGEMKDSMATVEEYEANLEKLDEAKCAMDDMHITIEQSIDDTDTDDIMKMLDDDIAAENSQVEVPLDLPEVPTTKPTITTTTEKKVEKRVAEME